MGFLLVEDYFKAGGSRLKLSSNWMLSSYKGKPGVGGGGVRRGGGNSQRLKDINVNVGIRGGRRLGRKPNVTGRKLNKSQETEKILGRG